MLQPRPAKRPCYAYEPLPSAARQLDHDVGRLHRSDGHDSWLQSKLVSRLPSDQRHDSKRASLYLDLGRHAVLDHPGHDAREAVARRLADGRRWIRPRQSRHVASKSYPIDLPLAAGRPRRLDLARVDEPPDRVRADPQQLGSLSDPQVALHPETVASAAVGGHL